MDRAFLRPPLAVRDAMDRMQLGLDVLKQDEDLVKIWLDFVCQRAVSAAMQNEDTIKCSESSPRTKRRKLSARESLPCTSS